MAELDLVEEHDSVRPRSAFAKDVLWTPEKRERQKELALRLMAEGRWGGAVGRAAAGSGRQRTPRMHEFLAEKARERAELIDRALHNMLKSGDKRIQLEAIREYRAAEDWAEKNQREEERELRSLKGPELDDALKGALAEILGVDLSLLESIEDIDDADVIEGSAEETVGISADSD